MTVFRRTAKALLSPAEQGVAEVLAEQTWMRDGVHTSSSEQRSWQRSPPVLAQDPVEAGLADVELLIEYQLPLTSRRADVVLAGVDRRTGGDAYVVVELKQWSRAEVWEDDPHRVLVHSTGCRPKPHPTLRPRTVSDAEADRLIRNTYKVLLTRGMMGTVLYSVDEPTQRFLSTLFG